MLCGAHPRAMPPDLRKERFREVFEVSHGDENALLRPGLSLHNILSECGARRRTARPAVDAGELLQQLPFLVQLLKPTGNVLREG